MLRGRPGADFGNVRLRLLQVVLDALPGFPNWRSHMLRRNSDQRGSASNAVRMGFRFIIIFTHDDSSKPSPAVLLQARCAGILSVKANLA